MSTFEMRQGVIAVSDPTIAAALLSNSVYWGTEEKDRIEGPTSQYQYKPGKFNGVERYRNKANGAVRVLFLIAGDPIDMKHRRWLFHHGCLFVNGKDFAQHRAMLMAQIADARADKSDPTRTLSVNERPIYADVENKRIVSGKERKQPNEGENGNETVG